jgi:hypothetical protein
MQVKQLNPLRYHARLQLARVCEEDVQDSNIVDVEKAIFRHANQTKDAKIYDQLIKETIHWYSRDTQGEKPKISQDDWKEAHQWAERIRQANLKRMAGAFVEQHKDVKAVDLIDSYNDPDQADTKLVQVFAD